jgi:hypothetical protein
MYNRVLATPGGPHAAADWARVTCEDLIPLDGIPAEHQSQGIILRGRLLEVLAEHYQAIQEAERKSLRDDAAACFATELDGHPDFGHLFAELQATAAGTPWEGHIGGPEVIDAIRQVVTDHIRHIRHIERLWHADRTRLEAGLAYRRVHGLPDLPEPPVAAAAA